jgi:hypothetical protein
VEPLRRSSRRGTGHLDLPIGGVYCRAKLVICQTALALSVLAPVAEGPLSPAWVRHRLDGGGRLGVPNCWPATNVPTPDLATNTHGRGTARSRTAIRKHRRRAGTRGSMSNTAAPRRKRARSLLRRTTTRRPTSSDARWLVELGLDLDALADYRPKREALQRAMSAWADAVEELSAGSSNGLGSSSTMCCRARRNPR